MCDLDRGFVLLLGVSHMSNTTLHGMEELAQVPYVLYPGWARVPLITPQGRQLGRTRVHNAFMQRNLNLLETDYIDAGAENVTRIGESPVRLINARMMRDITVDRLKRDPFALLNTQGRQAWERMKQTGIFTRDPLAAP